MRQVSLHALALAALLFVAATHPLYAEIEPGGAVKADTCADDGKTLGVSRTVEVDTNGGVNIGGDQKSATHFLNDGEVVLTFDDGPVKSSTKAILKALADQCTKATFFMVGQMALSDPEMVREVAAGGNTIGTHTWSHKNMRFAGTKVIDQQIESAISTVSKANGAPIAPLFRFPYLSSSRQAEAYLKGRNIGVVWVDVDSKDYLTRDPEVVKKRILAQLATTKKGIILMHDIHAWTAKMLPGLLAELHDKGFKVVHMVAKTPVETIASYDATAEKAIAAKTAAKAADPMAQRSLVWTMTPPPSAKHKVWKHTKKVQAKPSIVEGLPASSTAPAKAKSSGKTKDENQPWQLNLFN
jgi:peptidoglycan/xylan/chitin deacetylase (PgdA/CDA1 family)